MDRGNIMFTTDHKVHCNGVNEVSTKPATIYDTFGADYTIQALEIYEGTDENGTEITNVKIGANGNFYCKEIIED